MISYYLQILVGSLIGMLILISVKSVWVQQSRQYELGFIDAFKVYTTRYTGHLVVAGFVIVAVMFILPNLIANMQLEETGLPSRYTNFLKNFLKWLRLYSIGLGLVASGIGFIAVRKGGKFLREAEYEKATEPKKEDV